MSQSHHVRKHSKFSASGASRWFACPGSVELSEGLPDKSSPYALEGTRAHEVLEKLLLHAIQYGELEEESTRMDLIPREMFSHGIEAARFIYHLHDRTAFSEIQVETRVRLDFIHPEAFGTFDGAVVDHFGTLHVFDYKYGVGVVSPVSNLQMIFYGLGLAHQYQWNFKRVRLWIIQPRIRGYNGPSFWEIPLLELKGWVDPFKRAVDRVESQPGLFAEGEHCRWCKAKSICPLKRESKNEEAKLVFGIK